MKFVSVRTAAAREEMLFALNNSERVNERVKFDDRYGKPAMKLKQRGKTVYMTCEMIGGPSKDNGFIIGTFFLGRLTERAEGCRLRGIILTAPLYHLALIAFCVYFIIQSFIVGGITLVPLILVVFSFFLFKGEFRKQGTIKRFLARAAAFAERGTSANE